MKKTMCVLGFLAVASMAMAAFAPVTSVVVTSPTASQQLLQSITVGSYTVGGMIYGTSTGTGITGVYGIGAIDDKDLGTVAGRGTSSSEVLTVLFGGVNFVSTNGSLPDFFLFEAAGTTVPGNPDDVSVCAILPDGTYGTTVALPTIVSPTGWGDWGLKVAGSVQTNQAIVGLAFDITDLGLASDASIKGIRILAGPGIDPCAFCAVPEPATMSLLALGGLALLRKRS